MHNATMRSLNDLEHFEKKKQKYHVLPENYKPKPTDIDWYF